MKRLHRFLLLPASDRRLLVNASILLVTIRVGLTLLPFRTVRGLLAALIEWHHRFQGTNRFSTERIVWAVELAGRLIPRASTCLTQALAAQVLLLRWDHPALVHIGTSKGEGELRAHAWVESGGNVVIGEYDLEQYTPLVVLNGGRQ